MLNIKTLPQNVLSAVHVQPVLKYLPTSNPSERIVFAFNAKSFVIVFLGFFPSGLVFWTGNEMFFSQRFKINY